MMRATRYLILTLIALLTVTTATARTRTTQKQLRAAEIPVDMLAVDDDMLPDSLTAVDPTAVSLKGFNKRASDAKESFFVTNNTAHRMSAVRLLMRYTTLGGEMLHQRVITVPVSLKPGETRLVSVKSFDVQRLFYYYAGPKPRKSATPFKVAFRLVGYDIPVGN